jgi:malonyl CoA-acyl carrier protein transacylase
MPLANNAKTALLFPGLDALFMASKLKRWLVNPLVAETLEEASSHLGALTGEKEDLLAFTNQHSRPHLKDFDRTLIVLTALQLGIARQLKEPWHVAQGCSHGDVARSVICESITFAQAVQLLWTFATLRKNCAPGYTANVRNRDLTPLTAAQVNWLKSCDTPVSQWSDTNATIGGDNATLEKIIAESEAHGLKIKPVLPYPVHSPAMRPSMEALQVLTRGWPVKDPVRPVFSSLWVRYLRTGQEIHEEGLASAVSEVRWVETLVHLHEKEGVNCFLNVGPSNTLTGWLFASERFKNVTLLDGWEILYGKEGA